MIYLISREEYQLKVFFFVCRTCNLQIGDSSVVVGIIVSISLMGEVYKDLIGKSISPPYSQYIST